MFLACLEVGELERAARSSMTTTLLIDSRMRRPRLRTNMINKLL